MSSTPVTGGSYLLGTSPPDLATPPIRPSTPPAIPPTDKLNTKKDPFRRFSSSDLSELSPKLAPIQPRKTSCPTSKTQSPTTTQTPSMIWDTPTTHMRLGFLSLERKVVMFGAPIITGTNYVASDEMVTLLRQRGLEKVIQRNGWLLEDMGNLKLMEVMADHLHNEQQATTTGGSQQQQQRIHNGFAIGNALEKVYDAAYLAARRGAFVLTVGGDRSISSATISGVLKSRRDLCVVFVGSFADCHTPGTSTSREYHGMAAAHILGWFEREVKGFNWLTHFVPEHRCAFIALHHVDLAEAERMRESGMKIFSMYEVDRYGIGAVMDMAINSINPHNVNPIHLSLDLSACSDTAVPAFGTEGGLTFRESHFICEYLARTNHLGSMDLVHMCPREKMVLFEQKKNRVTDVVLDLIGSVIGKRIL